MIMICTRCGNTAVKSGKIIKGGEKVQRYQCNTCGYTFWEGQSPRKIDNTPNPPCPKCQSPSRKFGSGFKAGEKVRKYRCGTCGHVFLGGSAD